MVEVSKLIDDNEYHNTQKNSDNWDLVSLKDVAEVIMGQSPKSEFYNTSGKGLPLIQGNADIENRKTIIRNYTSFITKKGHKGDVIMSVRAPVGEVAKAMFDCCLGRGVCAIKAKTDYLFHYLVHIEDSWGKYSSRSTFDSVSSKQVKELPIYIPLTDCEQVAISTALTNADELIENLEKLIQKRRYIKQGVVQELLSGRIRLNGFNSEWKETKLGEIGKTYGGLSGKSKLDFEEGENPYIPFLNILNNPIINCSYFDYVKIRPNEKQNKAHKGDLFFNGSSETPEEVGMCSVLMDDIPELFLNSFCFGFRLFNQEEINGLFLSYYFRSFQGRKLIFSLAQGATRYNLSKTNFLQLKLNLPEVDEQTAIANIVYDMDKEIAALEQKLLKYQMIKQGMMQSLLTGKIRLV